MTPYYADEWLTVYAGDCRAVMSEMEPESVHCVVTSPPYWGLRDYGDAGQLGLEPTPEEYVANLVAVFREVRRVLRSDGTVWLNLGDSYAAQGGDGFGKQGAMSQRAGRTNVREQRSGHTTPPGLKPKDLVGIPWRVAFALQADGWYLRSDIIWAKPNPMPESVTDRPTKSHEYLFLLSKSPRYYYDADAVSEPSESGAGSRAGYAGYDKRALAMGREASGNEKAGTVALNGATRNLRSVWTIATQPYPGAHFATFPRKLVEPCIKAGSSERGVCPECGAPWVRVREFTGELYMTPDMYGRPRTRVVTTDDYKTDGDTRNRRSVASGEPSGLATRVHKTTGWQPSCAHNAAPIPATVLDCFAGSGTTGLVAQSLSRRAVLIDLNADYLIQAMGRNRDIPLGLTPQ